MAVVSGGYYLVKPAVRAEYMNHELLPERILSLSDCLCDSIPHTWSIEWTSETREVRESKAAKFGLGPAQLDQVISWVTEALDTGQVGWPNTFVDLDLARWFKSKFLSHADMVQLVGVGLPEDYCQEFLEEAALGGEAELGALTCVRQARPTADAGTVLGYEILGLDSGCFHSHICNSLENDFKAVLDIAPNAAGLIADEDQARRCAQYAALDSSPSEPALWQPWRVVLYE